MPYSIAVIDDDAQMLHQISSQLQEIAQKAGTSCAVHAFSSPMDLDELVYDAYFLDISMPQMDGIQVAKSIRDRGSMSCVVFISSVESRVFEAMRTQPLRFVRKTHLREELEEAMEAVVRQWQRFGSDTLVVTSSYQTVTIPINTILYIESFDKQQQIVTAQKTFSVYKSMAWFEKQLNNRDFFRIQRSYLVNMGAVVHIETGNVVLCDGTRLPISRFKTEEARKKLTRRLFNAPYQID